MLIDNLMKEKKIVEKEIEIREIDVKIMEANIQIKHLEDKIFTLESDKCLKEEELQALKSAVPIKQGGRDGQE